MDGEIRDYADHENLIVQGSCVRNFKKAESLPLSHHHYHHTFIMNKTVEGAYPTPEPPPRVKMMNK